MHGKDHRRLGRDLIDEGNDIFQSLGIIRGFRPVECEQVISFGLKIEANPDADLSSAIPKAWSTMSYMTSPTLTTRNDVGTHD